MKEENKDIINDIFVSSKISSINSIYWDKGNSVKVNRII